MARRLAVILTSTLVAGLAVVASAGPSSGVDGEPPTVGAPTITATSSASVSVSVSIDTHNSETTVQVEYVTAGAYRQRVPGPATTVTIATTPASDAGPVVVTGQVTALDPGSSYRMRVKAVNAAGETDSTSLDVSTPEAPRIVFHAKVGADTTKLTRLTVSGLVGTGAETVRITCKKPARGCPFDTESDAAVLASTLRLKSLFKGHALKPGAKVGVNVLVGGSKVTALTLTIRDDQQPKVKWN